MHVGQGGLHLPAGVRDQCGLGHLDHQPLELDSGGGSSCRQVGHPGRLAVGRRQVDRDVQIHSLFLPRERLAAGFVDHPVAQRPDQPDLLGERDEIARLYEPSLTVLPANERLHADEGLGLEVHERLIVQDETVPGLDRLAQAAGHRDLLQRRIGTAAIYRMPVASASFTEYIATSACLSSVSESSASPG